jgi:hypothetical protein
MSEGATVHGGSCKSGRERGPALHRSLVQADFGYYVPSSILFRLTKEKVRSRSKTDDGTYAPPPTCTDTRISVSPFPPLRPYGCCAGLSFLTPFSDHGSGIVAGQGVFLRSILGCVPDR